MDTIVLKFGGSSLADNEKLKTVANKIIEFHKRANKIVVVVSAQGKTTDKLIKEAYHLLGLRTFFTAGQDECRAWTFRQGMLAPELAGIIHTDFQRGFIKAETYSFDDLIAYGSEAALKYAGKIRQEGKQYVGQDGDIMLFKFNV